MFNYIPNTKRYTNLMNYNRCGKSGLKLPMISLGLWHNFGGAISKFNRDLICKAFDLGITHFDLANNYGLPAGSAEINFGRILSKNLKSYRNELVISSKAGYMMMEGPYGDGGSKKYLVNSINDSLKRLKIDYLDIFYHHRPDPETPLEETMEALDYIVKSGKALYIGLSNYNSKDFIKAQNILKSLGSHCIIHQLKYNILERSASEKELPDLNKIGVGTITYCPLAQGILSNRYLNGIPKDSRASKVNYNDMNIKYIKSKMPIVHKLNEIAIKRNQTLAQMSLAWILRQNTVSSLIIGVSKLDQLKENVSSLKNLEFSDECLKQIDIAIYQNEEN